MYAGTVGAITERVGELANVVGDKQAQVESAVRNKLRPLKEAEKKQVADLGARVNALIAETNKELKLSDANRLPEIPAEKLADPDRDTHTALMNALKLMADIRGADPKNAESMVLTGRALGEANERVAGRVRNRLDSFIPPSLKQLKPEDVIELYRLYGATETARPRINLNPFRR